MDLHKNQAWEFRTFNHRIRVADIKICNGKIVFTVKHKGTIDTFTLDELLREIYGQEMRCVVYGQDDTILIEI